MTDQLIMILSEFTQLMKDWESRLIPSERNLYPELKKINEKLTEELPKQKIPEINE